MLDHRFVSFAALLLFFGRWMERYRLQSLLLKLFETQVRCALIPPFVVSPLGALFQALVTEDDVGVLVQLLLQSAAVARKLLVLTLQVLDHLELLQLGHVDARQIAGHVGHLEADLSEVEQGLLESGDCRLIFVTELRVYGLQDLNALDVHLYLFFVPLQNILAYLQSIILMDIALQDVWVELVDVLQLYMLLFDFVGVVVLVVVEQELLLRLEAGQHEVSAEQEVRLFLVYLSVD